MHRTLDGTPVTGRISGFSEYSTIRKQTGSIAPGPIVSPDDVLAAIRKLESLFDQAEIDQALTLLYEHINDKNNPHNTKLDHFTQEVADIFYLQYKESGGTGSRDYYLECLFQTLRVATLEEMDDSDNPRLLISVRNAKRYVERHETDPNAHAALFERILPGLPPYHAPTYAIFANVGMSPYNSTYEGAPFTYVGQDGMIHYSEPGFAPTDYSTGVAAFPCFKQTTNLITDSEVFVNMYHENVGFMEKAERDPMGNTNATALFALKADGPVEHMVCTDPITLQQNTPSTFSVYAKMDKCRYLAISFRDFIASDLMVRGIYDLDAGKCIILNHMNRYTADIQPLANGWFRCILTMYHEFGQIAPVQMTFFKEKKSDYSLSFENKEECLGYLWGMQYEENRTASPYIYTNGMTETRAAIDYKIPVDDSLLPNNKHTICVTWVDNLPLQEKCNLKYGIVSTRCNHLTLMEMLQLSDKDIEIDRYAIMTVGDAQASGQLSMSGIKYQEGPTSKLAYSFGNNRETRICFNNEQEVEASPIITDKPDVLYLGKSGGKYFNGYITSFVIYPCEMDELNMKFLHGEQVDG